MDKRTEIAGRLAGFTWAFPTAVAERFNETVFELMAEVWLEGEAAGWNNANAADSGMEVVNHNPYRPRENYLKDLRD